MSANINGDIGGLTNGDVGFDVDCPICCEHMTEPLLLQCTHSFCRLCLLKSTRLSPAGRQCPGNQPFHISHSKPPTPLLTVVMLLRK